MGMLENRGFYYKTAYATYIEKYLLLLDGAERARACCCWTGAARAPADVAQRNVEGDAAVRRIYSSSEAECTRSRCADIRVETSGERKSLNESSSSTS